MDNFVYHFSAQSNFVQSVGWGPASADPDAYDPVSAHSLWSLHATPEDATSITIPNSVAGGLNRRLLSDKANVVHRGFL